MHLTPIWHGFTVHYNHRKDFTTRILPRVTHCSILLRLLFSFMYKKTLYSTTMKLFPSFLSILLCNSYQQGRVKANTSFIQDSSLQTAAHGASQGGVTQKKALSTFFRMHELTDAYDWLLTRERVSAILPTQRTQYNFASYKLMCDLSSAVGTPHHYQFQRGQSGKELLLASCDEPHLIDVCAMGSVALHAFRTWPTTETINHLSTSHSWVAGVGITGCFLIGNICAHACKNL